MGNRAAHNWKRRSGKPKTQHWGKIMEDQDGTWFDTELASVCKAKAVGKVPCWDCLSTKTSWAARVTRCFMTNSYCFFLGLESVDNFLWDSKAHKWLEDALCYSYCSSNARRCYPTRYFLWKDCLFYGNRYSFVKYAVRFSLILAWTFSTFYSGMVGKVLARVPRAKVARAKQASSPGTDRMLQHAVLMRKHDSRHGAVQMRWCSVMFLGKKSQTSWNVRFPTKAECIVQHRQPKERSHLQGYRKEGSKSESPGAKLPGHHLNRPCEKMRSIWSSFTSWMRCSRCVRKSKTSWADRNS